MSLRTMGQSAVTMNQLQQQMDTIGHNMANSSTPGYKSKQAEFSSLLFQQMQNVTSPENARGRMTPDGMRIGTGAQLGSVRPNMNLGSIQTTDRDLDIALLQPSHYFQVTTEENGVEEISYTRDGAFYLQPVNDGEEVVIVNGDGYPLMGTNGPIQFSAANISGMHIAENGAVMVDRNGQSEQVGTINVVAIDQANLLEANGDNLYQLPDEAELGVDPMAVAQPVPAMDGIMQNKSLEMSNVDISDTMTQLMNAQRSYQFNARAMTTADQMQELINQIR